MVNTGLVNIRPVPSGKMRLQAIEKRKLGIFKFLNKVNILLVIL
jgi:hypothetical protein